MQNVGWSTLNTLPRGGTVKNFVPIWLSDGHHERLGLLPLRSYGTRQLIVRKDPVLCLSLPGLLLIGL